MIHKRILFICYQNLKPGGVARALTSLANELCKDNYDVTILFLTKGNNDFYDIAPEIKTIEIDTFGKKIFKIPAAIVEQKWILLPHKSSIQNYLYDFAQWYLLRKWLLKHHSQYDVIISSWYKISSQISIYKDIAKKTIAWENANYNVGGKFWKDKFRPRYKNLKNVVYANKGSEQYYNSIHNNAILIPYIVGDPFENISVIDFEAKKNQLIYVGRLDLEKNVQSLINIIQKVDMKDFIFKIVGDGPEFQNLKEMVLKRDLSSKVTFTGTLSIQDIKTEMMSSKIFLFASLTESFGMVLLESIFSGNAVIAYDCDFGPSDIINENNGFLVPISNEFIFERHLQFLINHPETLKKLNKTAAIESSKWKKHHSIRKWKVIIDMK